MTHGSAHAHEAGAGAHRTSMGLDSRKMAFWAFIGSECLLFGSLISTYLVYKGRSLTGPFPHEILRADRHSRCSRDGRCDLAADALGAGAARKTRSGERDDGRDHGTLLAFRGCRVDRDLYGRVPDSMRGKA